jgi:Flp pilus assembly pilin Flp
MQGLVSRFIKDESGAAAIEYGATALGSAISDKFTSIGTSVTNAGK